MILLTLKLSWKNLLPWFKILSGEFVDDKKLINKKEASSNHRQTNNRQTSTSAEFFRNWS